jgi:hypothetical protein
MGKGNKGGVIKTIVTSFYVNGALKDEPDSKSKLLRFSKDTIAQLGRVVRLIMTSDFVSESSKLYYSNVYMTISGVYLKERDREDTTFNKVKNRIAYDTAKVSRHFGDTLQDIVMCREPDLGRLALKLEALYRKHMNEFSLQDKILLKMPSVKPCSILSHDEYMRVISILKTYSKKAVKDAEESIGYIEWGYVEHLLQNQSELNTVDEFNLAILKEAVGHGNSDIQIKDEELLKNDEC